MEASVKTRIPLHSIDIFNPSPSLHTALHLGIIFNHIPLYHWGESKKGSDDSVLAFHAKGGESISPKQKDRTTTNFKILVFQLVLKKDFQIGILFVI